MCPAATCSTLSSNILLKVEQYFNHKQDINHILSKQLVKTGSKMFDIEFCYKIREYVYQNKPQGI